MSARFGRPAAAGLFCLLCAGLPGCIVVGENSSEPHIPTVGRELRDLKVARDEGALAPEEYDEARRNLLTRFDKPRRS